MPLLQPQEAIQEVYLKQIFHFLQDGIIVMNQDRKILLMNPSAQQMTGWDIGECVPYCTYCQGRELKEGENRCYLVSHQEVPYFLSQMPVYKGSKLDVEMSTAVIYRDQTSNEQEILLVLRDQTLKKKEEEARISKWMIKKLIGAQEQEHKRLAQELHDGVGQSLFSISIAMNAIEAYIENPKMNEYISEVKSELDKVIQDVNSYSHRLRPLSLDQLGLIPTLEELLHSYRQLLPQIDFHFQCNFDRRLSTSIEINLYRVIQEALHNIVKYAKATQVWVQLFQKKETLYLIIRDNGVGFDLNQTGEGLGLKHMNERVDQLDGDFTIQSSQQGTEIRVFVPLEGGTPHD